MRRLYKISVPGGHNQCDALIEKCKRLGLGPVGGSGVLGDEAFIQLWKDNDGDAMRAAHALTGKPTGWTLQTGYGIHRRTIMPTTDRGSV